MSMSKIVHLNSKFENDLITAARKRKPYEICGVIYGTESNNGIVTADSFSLIRNRSIDPTETFSFHPEDWIHTYFQSLNSNRNIIGLFHTHPNNAPVPSTLDDRGALPWRTYWIIGLYEQQYEIAVYQRNGEANWIKLTLIREV